MPLYFWEIWGLMYFYFDSGNLFISYVILVGLLTVFKIVATSLTPSILFLGFEATLNTLFVILINRLVEAISNQCFLKYQGCIKVFLFL